MAIITHRRPAAHFLLQAQVNIYVVSSIFVYLSVNVSKKATYASKMSYDFKSGLKGGLKSLPEKDGGFFYV